MRHLAGGVVFVEDGDNLAEDCAELRGGDVTILLQLRHEAHESGRGVGVISALPLELGAQ